MSSKVTVQLAASEAIDSGLIPIRVKLVATKFAFTSSLLDAQHYTNSVENKQESLLVVPLGKAFSGIAQIIEWKAGGLQILNAVCFYAREFCQNGVRCVSYMKLELHQKEKRK